MTKLLTIVAGVITEQDIPTGGGGGSVSFVTVPFTDGDTYRRVTIANTSVTATSKILVSVQRPDIATDAADLGFVYFANVVNRTAGVSFDVTIVCSDWGLADATESPPNETITLCYMIG
jgi:hypothetical protein